MPRWGWRKAESGPRLTDHIALGVLTQTVPPALVDAVVAETGRQERRQRLLPARVLVYYVLALALHSDVGYEEVMRYVVDGLTWQAGWRGTWTVPTKAALFKGRVRLGVAPLRTLFERIAQPLGGPDSRGVWYRRWRLMSLDGTTLDVADTAANHAYFGRPHGGRGAGVGAFPQQRVVALLESGTHAVVRAVLGPYRLAERKAAATLLPALEPSMLLLADRGFYSAAFWAQAAATGAALVWRVRQDLHLPVRECLADGSYRSRVYPDARARQRDRDGRDVRVIEYTLGEAVPGEPAPPGYRLITTLLDPAAAPAAELAALYHERWEIEQVFDELKTHQRGPRMVLRSKTPEGVQQETYGYLLAHFAIRRLMHDAAVRAETDPDRLSFTHTLHVVRRQLGGPPPFSP
jgi:hypothetical protein